MYIFSVKYFTNFSLFCVFNLKMILQGFPRFIGGFPLIFGGFPYFFRAFPRTGLFLAQKGALPHEEK